LTPLSSTPQPRRRIAVVFEGDGALSAAENGAPDSFQLAPGP
jgi:hypothetical protein